MRKEQWINHKRKKTSPRRDTMATVFTENTRINLALIVVCSPNRLSWTLREQDKHDSEVSDSMKEPTADQIIEKNPQIILQIVTRWRTTWYFFSRLGSFSIKIGLNSSTQWDFKCLYLVPINRRYGLHVVVTLQAKIHMYSILIQE